MEHNFSYYGLRKWSGYKYRDKSVTFNIYSIKESCFDSFSPLPVLLNIFLLEPLESPLEFAKESTFILNLFSLSDPVRIKELIFYLLCITEEGVLRKLSVLGSDINCELLLLKLTLLFIEFIGVIEIGLAVFL
jgi:hypothetical protein